MKCPYKNCSKKIDESTLVKEWHPEGRSAKCPHCGKKIIFFKTARGFIQQKDGSLKRMFRNA